MFYWINDFLYFFERDIRWTRKIKTVTRLNLTAVFSLFFNCATAVLRNGIRNFFFVFYCNWGPSICNMHKSSKIDVTILDLRWFLIKWVWLPKKWVWLSKYFATCDPLLPKLLPPPSRKKILYEILHVSSPHYFIGPVDLLGICLNANKANGICVTQFFPSALASLSIFSRVECILNYSISLRVVWGHFHQVNTQQLPLFLN